MTQKARSKLLLDPIQNIATPAKVEQAPKIQWISRLKNNKM